MKLIKRQNKELTETVITLEYIKWTGELEELESFIKGNHESIVGYIDKNEICNIRIADVLYFEAVGELVFAYADNAVYEMKMRLYQIEEKIAKLR